MAFSSGINEDFNLTLVITPWKYVKWYYFKKINIFDLPILYGFKNEGAVLFEAATVLHLK